MITLESVKTTSFAYHIMKPEGVAKYKHVCLSKSDYDYIINLAGGTPASYVSALARKPLKTTPMFSIPLSSMPAAFARIFTPIWSLSS